MSKKGRMKNQVATKLSIRTSMLKVAAGVAITTVVVFGIFFIYGNLGVSDDANAGNGGTDGKYKKKKGNSPVDNMFDSMAEFADGLKERYYYYVGDVNDLADYTKNLEEAHPIKETEVIEIDDKTISIIFHNPKGDIFSIEVFDAKGNSIYRRKNISGNTINVKRRLIKGGKTYLVKNQAATKHYSGKLFNL